MKTNKVIPLEIDCEQCGYSSKLLNIFEDGSMYCEDCRKILERAQAVQEIDND